MSVGLTPESVELLDQGSPGARQALAKFGDEILQSAFPPEQYVPGQYAGDGPLDGPILIACDQDGSVLGGAIGEIFEDSNTLLLAYIAVRRDLRSSGIGRLLMHAIEDRWVTPDRLAVLEIEDPRHHPDHPDWGDPQARIRFYARFGIQALAAPYFQPRLGAELPRSYHLILAAMRVPQRLRAGSGIEGATVERFMERYFMDCEGDAALDDPELQWLLNSYRVPEIGLVPIDDLAHIPDPEPPSLAGDG